jgi:hypothetical protein
LTAATIILSADGGVGADPPPVFGSIPFWTIGTISLPAPRATPDPRPGTPLAEKVIKQIHGCDAMVVLLTEAGARCHRQRVVVLA